jgi:hypothetical protein
MQRIVVEGRAEPSRGTGVSARERSRGRGILNSGYFELDETRSARPGGLPQWTSKRKWTNWSDCHPSFAGSGSR